MAFYWKLETGGIPLVLIRTVAWITFWSLGSASVSLLANFLMYIYQPKPALVIRYLYIGNTIYMIVTRFIEWSLYSYYTVNGTWAEAVTISDKVYCLCCYILGASFCWIQWTWVSQHAQRSRILIFEDLRIWKRAHEEDVLVEEKNTSLLLRRALKTVQVTFIALLCRKLLALH